MNMLKVTEQMKALPVIMITIMLVSCIPANSTPIKTIHPPVANSTQTRLSISATTAFPTHTATATPSVWQIWFRGFSCEGLELCELGPNQDLHYFSINSDGTGLKTLSITSFPTPGLPDYAPPLPDGFATTPQLSPDKSMLTYSARDDDRYSLYTVAISSGKAIRLYQPEMIQNHIFWIGTACWTPTGQTVEFLLHSRRGSENQPPVLYSIDLDGDHLQALFSFPGLENAWFGACSPDGEELVLTIPGNMNVEENGIYLINRNTGHIRQILSNFYASIVRTP
jgi:hypothetical protein